MKRVEYPSFITALVVVSIISLLIAFAPTDRTAILSAFIGVAVLLPTGKTRSE